MTEFPLCTICGGPAHAVRLTGGLVILRHDCLDHDVLWDEPMTETRAAATWAMTYARKVVSPLSGRGRAGGTPETAHGEPRADQGQMQSFQEAQ